MSDTATLSRKADFPGLAVPDGGAWHYLDSAATAQKPQAGRQGRFILGPRMGELAAAAGEDKLLAAAGPVLRTSR